MTIQRRLCDQLCIRDMSSVGFLVYLLNFFALSFDSRRARTSGPIWTVYTSYDVFPRTDVPLGICNNTAPNFEVKSQKTYFGSVNKHL